MTEKEKAAAGMLYFANTDKEITEAWQIAKERCFEYNATHPGEKEKRDRLIKQLLGKTGEHLTVVSPFYCDYGVNIEVGEGFFANMNLVILDGAKVKIGSHVFIAPNVGIYTAGHPYNVEQRNQGLEYAYPVTIGDNVWIGAQVAILPDVSIGDNTVIGAGSVVTKNVPAGVLAAGNPCKVIREINEKDKEKYK